MMYKYAHDLPKELDTDGKLIPKHDGIVEGWYLLHGLPSGTSWTRTTSVTLSAFHFNEKYITKTTALDVLDDVRHRKGLMDHVDLSGLTYLD